MISIFYKLYKFTGKYKSFLALTVLCTTVLNVSGQKRSNNTLVTYNIKQDIIVSEPVSPLLYGNLLELGFGRSENIWAELLYNRDFEFDKPYSNEGWLTYDRKTPQLEDWWHSGYEESKWHFVKANTDNSSTGERLTTGYWPTAHGKFFVTLDNKSGNTPVYYAQDSLYLKKGVGYHFSGLFSNGTFFSGDQYGRKVEVIVGLYPNGDFTKPIVEKTFSINSNQFNKFETDLPPTQYEGRATFAIKLVGKTNLSFDLLSLMPSNNVKGWNGDVVKLMNNSVPAGIIRFPGGCFASLYNWRDGIGKTEDRPVSYDTWWGNIFTNDIGTVEFVDLCKETKAEPLLCVPVMFDTPENARDWVDFCNNPNNELRNRIGRPEPLNVKYWELDNETYRRLDAISYAKKCVEFAKAMKKVDPTIKLIMGNYFVFHDKFEEMLEIASPYIDIISNRGGSVEELTGDLKVLAAFNAKHKTDIKLCHTEFRAPLEIEGPAADGLNKPVNESKESLFTQSVRWKHGLSILDQYIKYQKFGGAFAFANLVNYTDGWGENEINIAKEGPFLSAVGKSVAFLNKLAISYPLKIENESAVKDVAVQAAWNDKKDQLTIVVLNFSTQKKSLSFNIEDLKNQFKNDQKVITLSAKSLMSFNSPTDKEAVNSINSTMNIKNKKFVLNVNANSATAVEFISK
ncbi:hypothetical protein EZJ43_09495 [Pedobacter changchengzhani]|uniref:Alpha-L-arabinofuranosidase 1 catalytic domain-containing protein n=1 Tax=Pedobacter changchengzhani TaxID=2529274 RepID=A0A4R5MKH9_9SPHI|nr:hypothetical protein [Pedobacter changchengzhani]TDG36227.1 hypothetical protein EZJ43_09495 [Pedobacter changchengzhani]